jgi:hypothetical protein
VLFFFFLPTSKNLDLLRRLMVGLTTYKSLTLLTYNVVRPAKHVPRGLFGRFWSVPRFGLIFLQFFGFFFAQKKKKRSRAKKCQRWDSNPRPCGHELESCVLDHSTTLTDSQFLEGGVEQGARENERSAGKKGIDTISIEACHPCAGTMLIFSVSFQF